MKELIDPLRLLPKNYTNPLNAFEGTIWTQPLTDLYRLFKCVQMKYIKRLNEQHEHFQGVKQTI